MQDDLFRFALVWEMRTQVPQGRCGVKETIPMPVHLFADISQIRSLGSAPVTECFLETGHDGWHRGELADVHEWTLVGVWTGSVRYGSRQ